jgi:hypothetical protein
LGSRRLFEMGLGTLIYHLPKLGGELTDRFL